MPWSWDLRPISKFRFLALTLLLAAWAVRARATEGGASAPEFVEQTYLTEEAALKTAFPGCDRVERKVYKVSEGQREKIESRLGWTFSESTVTVFEGFSGNQPRGRAMITEEIGKFKPVTFIVKADNDGKVERVDVMVYREAVGEEVRRSRFTRQFRGKTSKDPLRINRDIINVTGATMSVQAMTAGVKKVLVILDEMK